jgi:hypothetical protein
MKQLYSDRIQDLIPEGVKLLNKIPFNAKQKLGDYYHQPVILSHEHGVTFSSAGGEAFTLNDAINGVMKDAQVRGSELVLRSRLSYAAASRSLSSEAAFKDATKLLVQNMLRSVTKKLEIEMLYGQVGYGVVSAVSGFDITISQKEWAPGIFAGAEGMKIQIRDSTGVTPRVGTATITSVNFDTRTITVDAVPTGTIATDVIWHDGAYNNEFAGVHKIISNSSTLFNIDASVYNLWKGNTYDAGNAKLSFNKIQDAIAKAVEKGLDSDVVVMVNPLSWADLLSEQAALRRYDGSYSSSIAEAGSKEIKFHGQNGMVEIIPSIFVKRGYAYVLCMEDFMRVGSTEVTFQRPGKQDEFFRELENSAGFELRSYCDMALFTSSPSKNVLISNIDDTAS